MEIDEGYLKARDLSVFNFRILPLRKKKAKTYYTNRTLWGNSDRSNGQARRIERKGLSSGRRVTAGEVGGHLQRGVALAYSKESGLIRA